MASFTQPVVADVILVQRPRCQVVITMLGDNVVDSQICIEGQQQAPRSKENTLIYTARPTAKFIFQIANITTVCLH